MVITDTATSYISKTYLNTLVNRHIINESISINDSNRVDTTNKIYDVFLSYCYTDKAYAMKIVNLFEKVGYSVYIDLRDSALSRNKKVDRKTVIRIASIMNRCKSLVYVHTASAKMSKWCPWELGYMSGKKNFRCATILLIEDKEEFPRQEYLDIYPFLTFGMDANNRQYDFFAHDLDNKSNYVPFKDYINNGRSPYHH